MADYKRKISKKSVFVIIVLMYIVVEVLILTYLPMIPIRKCADEIKQYYPIIDTDSAYSVRCNIFGDVVFANANKADKKFKSEYGDVIDYLVTQKEFQPFSYKSKVLDLYFNNCWKAKANEQYKSEDGVDMYNRVRLVGCYAEVCLNATWYETGMQYFDSLFRIYSFGAIVLGINVAAVIAFVVEYKRIVLRNRNNENQMADYKRKSSRKSLFIIIMLMYIVVEVLILIYLPMIPIRKCPDEIKQYYPLVDTDSAYSVRLNIFGDVVFTNAYKADKKFKSEYGDVIDYLVTQKDFQPFSYKGEVLDLYFIHCWQINVGGQYKTEDDINLYNRCSMVGRYAQVCLNATWYGTEMQYFDSLFRIYSFGAIVLGINVVAVITFVVGYKKYFLIHVKKA